MSPSNRLKYGVPGLLAAVLLALPAAAEDEKRPRWEFLSRSTIGAEQFTDAHPEWDGRGVLIAVCDSGVELGLPGLAETSHGKPKILDARTFTDDATTKLDKATRGEDDQGPFFQAKGDRKLYGADGLSPGPAKDTDVLLGWITEKSLVGGRFSDLNNDGRSDGVCGILAFRAEGAGPEDPWTAYVDTDLDGDLADEKAVRDYSVARDTFRLRGATPDHKIEKTVLYALNLWEKEKKAALYFGGGHGTHVAGICAGHSLNGQQGFDGVAPGAQILALKIGSSTASGGATTPGSMLAAWRYAVKKAKELEMPLVIQMSYSVGSELEGASVAEKLIDKLLDANPGVVATVSAGNAGPGLSTIGLPACSREVFCIGASYAKTTARDVHGVRLPADRMFGFSSRGGDTARPDFVCPGFAASSVPDYFKGSDVMSGTSMSAPSAAGACALLYSAAKSKDLPIRRDVLRAAILRTATPLPGYGPLDQGAGMAQVPAAFEVYEKLASAPEHTPVGFRIVTTSPEMSSGKGETVFYRGDYFPRGGDEQIVKVRPVFPKGAPEAFKARYFQAFDLRSEAPWVRLGKDAAYIKQSAAAQIPITFDEEALREPGLYQTRILGYARAPDGNGGGPPGPAFVVPVAVVVPYRFDLAAGGVVVHHSLPVDSQMVDRCFLHVPPWVAAVKVTARVPDFASTRAGADLALFDPEGRRSYLGRLREDNRESERVLETSELGAGVWEFCATGARSSLATAQVEYTFEAFAMARPLGGPIEITHEAGKKPTGELTLGTALGRPWKGRGTGTVIGWGQSRDHAVKGARFNHKFTLGPDEKGIRFTFSTSPEDWGLFTDVAVRIVAADGTSPRSTAMNYSRETFTFEPEERGGTFTFEVYAGVADPAEAKTVAWKLELEETRLLASPVGVRLTRAGAGTFTLYPDREETLTLTLDHSPPSPPTGFVLRADVTLSPQADGASMPLHLDLHVR